METGSGVNSVGAGLSFGVEWCFISGFSRLHIRSAGGGG